MKLIIETELKPCKLCISRKYSFYNNKKIIYRSAYTWHDLTAGNKNLQVMTTK